MQRHLNISAANKSLFVNLIQPFTCLEYISSIVFLQFIKLICWRRDACLDNLAEGILNMCTI